MGRARLGLVHLEWAEGLVNTAATTVRKEAISFQIDGGRIVVLWNDHSIYNFMMLFIGTAVCSNRIISCQYLK